MGYLDEVRNTTGQTPGSVIYQVPLVPLSLLMQKGMSPTGPYIIDGQASTGERDQDGEVIMQAGVDFDMFKQHGKINWNHDTTDVTRPSSYVGTVLKIYHDDNGNIHVRASLFQNHPGAEEIINLFKDMSTASPDPYLGYSVEMQKIQRDPRNRLIIRKCTMTGLAITCIPCNPSVRVRIVTPTQKEIEVYSTNKSCVFTPYWEGKSIKKSITQNPNFMNTENVDPAAQAIIDAVLKAAPSNGEKSVYNNNIEGQPVGSPSAPPPDGAQTGGDKRPVGQTTPNSIGDGSQGTSPPADKTPRKSSSKSVTLTQEEIASIAQKAIESYVKNAKEKEDMEKEKEKDKKAKPDDEDDKDPKKEKEKSTTSDVTVLSSTEQYAQDANAGKIDAAQVKAIQEAEEKKQEAMKQLGVQEAKHKSNLSNKEVGLDPRADITYETIFDPEVIDRIEGDASYNFNDGGFAAKEFGTVLARTLDLDPEGYANPFDADALSQTARKFVNDYGPSVSVFTMPIDEDIAVSHDQQHLIRKFLRKICNRRVFVAPACSTEEILKQQQVRSYRNGVSDTFR